MNPLLTTKQETFRAGTDNLEFFRERLLKMNNGALMFLSLIHISEPTRH